MRLNSRPTSIVRFAAICLALGLLTAFGIRSAAADYISPALVQVKTKSYTPVTTKFPLGTYEYAVNWQGIPVGIASITVKSAYLPDPAAPQEIAFDVTANAKTGRVISWFYKLNHTSESIFRKQNLAPVSFFSEQTENSKAKSREVYFKPDGSIKATLWKKGKEDPEEEISFHTDNATFDPISAAFLARSLPVEEGEELSFDVFNGKHRFLIGLKVDAKETISVNGTKRLAYRVTPSVRKLTDTEGEKRLRSATLWISADDDRRDVLKVKSEVFVGSVNAQLESFTPFPDDMPPTTARASLKPVADAPAK
ncbi:MAG: DUF3108 domain-containing protein [Bdellovibrionota bacterium]